jgi:DNA-binding transcriptional LysR family regulator
MMLQHHNGLKETHMLPDLESLRCFVAAARPLNFRAASHSVGLTPAALGKRIKNLEEQLGAPLFHRTTRHVALSEQGLRLLPKAQEVLLSAEGLVIDARGGEGLPAMDINLGTRYELGLSWIIPTMPALSIALPRVSLHLYFGSGEDLELRVRTLEIDCAISSRPIVDPHIDHLNLHDEVYTFVGSPSLLSARPLKTPADAGGHTLVDIQTHLPLLNYYRDAPGGEDRIRFARVIRIGSIAGILALVLRGDGVAVLPNYFVEPYLRKGQLQVIFPGSSLLDDHFRIIFRRDDPRRTVYESIATVMQETPLQ